MQKRTQKAEENMTVRKGLEENLTWLGRKKSVHPRDRGWEEGRLRNISRSATKPLAVWCRPRAFLCKCWYCFWDCFHCNKCYNILITYKYDEHSCLTSLGRTWLQMWTETTWITHQIYHTKSLLRLESIIQLCLQCFVAQQDLSTPEAYKCIPKQELCTKHSGK